ncbi:hypothetical protein Si116_00340 [Streptococcus infantarius subsp. infantarius]|nr:hypothetical protein [Streptococcus infantarius subsp. infantarius]MCO4490938.1 hypothetical protein [Streptococcus infantarius subsp. infantarius]MCO4491624.1 hypothetical protein [Streptococcus infantarius subsp. infantarius]MCO4507365.1 hypothetical protein [Streptococcus infantarius subsp. infantarius]MCO4516951.1 hypothetical protein [Streptococcus infantarius subsp. infantarius]
MKIGNKDFFYFWENSKAASTSDKARLVLQELMDILEMPEELSGEIAQTRKLLNQFSDNLSPNHLFWSELARLVQVAYPGESMTEDNLLSHQVHQFRYVISAYQAQWVREEFPAKSDWQSMLAYLKDKKERRFWRRRFDFDLTESARLHNKAPKHVILGFELPINLKILLAFHTEFILDSRGHFANEIDPQGQTHNGIINGASFNYANHNDQRHYELDVAAIKRHDPLFRKRILANQGNTFLAPLWIKCRRHEDWERSYFNKKGHYARQGRSSYQMVKQLIQRFRKDLHNCS